MFDADNNYITNPGQGYIKAKASFVKENSETTDVEKDFDKTLFSDSDTEFYARLKIDLNT